MNATVWWEMHDFVVGNRRNLLSRDLIVVWLNVDINIESVALGSAPPPPGRPMACYGETFTFPLAENIVVEYTLANAFWQKDEEKKENVCKTCARVFELF
jgi:hypothetical protein